MSANELFMNARQNPISSLGDKDRRVEDALREEMSWTEAIQNRGEALGYGALHGITSTAPEQAYRAIRTISRMLGDDDTYAWASDNIREIAVERKTDPFYKVDPQWVNDEWGRSLYEGANSLTSSIVLGLPAVGAAAVAATAGAPIAAGAGLSLGAAFFSNALGGAAVGSLAEYDNFMDEAYEELSQLNPELTRDQIEDQSMWQAIISGAAEGGLELAGDLLGGKLVGLFGKAGAEPARHILQKLLFKSMGTMGIEVTGEGLTAVIQDAARKTNGMTHQGAGKAFANIIGPTLVSAGLSGAGRTLANNLRTDDNTQEQASEAMTLLTQDMSPERRKEVLKNYREGIEDKKAEARISPEAYKVFTQLRAAEWNPEEARVLTRQLEDEALRWSEETGGQPSEYFKIKQEQLGDGIQQGLSSRLALINAFSDRGANLETVLENSMSFLKEDLNEEQRVALEDTYAPNEEGEVRDVRSDLISYIRSGRKAPKGLEMTPELSSAFRGMRDKMLNSYGIAQEMGKVSLKPETIAILEKSLGKEFKPSAPAKTKLFTMRGEDFNVDRIMDRVSKAENPDKAEAFAESLGSEIRLNLDAFDVDDIDKVLMGELHKQFGKDFEEKLYEGNTDAEIEARAMREFKEFDLTVEHFQQKAAELKNVDGAKLIKQAKFQLTVMRSMTRDLCKDAKESGRVEDKNAARIAGIATRDMLAAYRGLQKEAGTMVRAFRGSKNDDLTVLEKQTRLLEGMGGEEATDVWINAMLNAPTPEGRTKVLAGANSKTMNNIIEVAMTGMLSSPKTHLVNIIGNGWALLEEVFNRATAATLGGDTGVRKGEAGAMASAAASGFMEALSAGWNTFKTNESRFGATRAASEMGLTAEHDEISGGLSSVSDYVWHGLKGGKLAFRLLGGADEFFQVMAYNMEIEATKHREALNVTKAQAGSPEYLAVMEELTANLPDDIHKDAIDFSKYVTFKTDMGDVGKFINKMRAKHPSLYAVLPFVKTPINIWKWGANRTPGLANLMKEHNDAVNSGDPVQQQLADARVTTGSLIWISALSIAAGGFITGPGPSDPDEREKLRATGWQPNSLKVGGTYIALDRVDPLSFLLTTAAALNDAVYDLDEENASSLYTAALGASISALSNRTYLESVIDTFEMLKDPERHLEGYLGRRATMLIPMGAAFREARRQTDPVQREVESIFDAVLNNLPGFSEALPVRRNYLGERIEVENLGGLSAINPFAVSFDADDVVAEEIYRLKQQGHIQFGRMSQNMTHRGAVAKLEGKDYSDLQGFIGTGLEINGKTQKQAIEDVLTSSQYARLSDEDKGTAIERVVRKYRKAGSKQFKRERPELWLVQ